MPVRCGQAVARRQAGQEPCLRPGRRDQHRAGDRSHGLQSDRDLSHASCEFSGKLLVIDREATKLIKVNGGPHGLLARPQPGSFSLGHTGNTR